jgi:hypothetical protein
MKFELAGGRTAGEATNRRVGRGRETVGQPRSRPRESTTTKAGVVMTRTPATRTVDQKNHESFGGQIVSKGETDGRFGERGKPRPKSSDAATRRAVVMAMCILGVLRGFRRNMKVI